MKHSNIKSANLHPGRHCLGRARRLFFFLLAITALVIGHSTGADAAKLLRIGQDPEALSVVSSAFSAQAADLSTTTGQSFLPSIVSRPSDPIILHGALLYKLHLDDFQADSSFTFSFIPELAHNTSDYTVSVTCSNGITLREEDVNIGPPVMHFNGVANYTIGVFFERSVGISDLTITFLRSVDRSIYASITVRYIVVGISFFRVDAAKGTHEYLPRNRIIISSYTELLHNPLITFSVFIQFPDGSSSSKMMEDSPSTLPSIHGIKTTVSGLSLIPSQSFDNCISGHAAVSESGSLFLSSGCSFGFSDLLPSKDFLFGVRVLQYRVGDVIFYFKWDEFFAGTDFEESYETSLTIRVLGLPPLSIAAVSPPGPFKKSGGQRITLSVLNMSSREELFVFELDGEQLEATGSAVKSAQGGWVDISFITPPGYGTDVPWELKVLSPTDSKGNVSAMVTVPWANDSPRFSFNYVDTDVTLSSVTPSFGPVAGGTLITCSGFFGNFNLAAGSGDAIFFGGYRLENKFIFSSSQTKVVFSLPPKSAAQNAMFHFGIFFLIHGIRTNELPFAYESLNSVRIDVMGSSFDEANGIHLISLCPSAKSSISEDTAVSLLSQLNKGAPTSEHLIYEWHLVVRESRAAVAFPPFTSLSEGLALKHGVISPNVEYEVAVVVKDRRYGTTVRHVIYLKGIYTRMLGVSLATSGPRSIAFPPIDVRITASISELTSCYSDSSEEIVFEWTYDGLTTPFSHASLDIDENRAGPRRLGREFMIPRNTLRYGVHLVKLKAIRADNPDIYGVGEVELVVEPAPLRAIIGSGESLVRVSTGNDLQVSGSQSWDPDAAAVNETIFGQSLEYQWECELSTDGEELFTSVGPCPESLLSTETASQKQFTVPRATLSLVYRPAQSVYIRYLLVVHKEYSDFGTRWSARASQVLELLPVDAPLTDIGIIDLSSGDGSGSHMVHPENLKYSEPFVLTPHAPENVEWRYRVVKPQNESFTFLMNPSNLLELPGFYQPQTLLAGRQSLGIRPDVLMPDTEYTFEIEYESSNGVRSRSVELTVRTMPKPTVIFPALMASSGTTDSILTAYAVPSYIDVEFIFYFYLIMEDKTELCIDGCSGNRVVNFRIPRAGKYGVRCVLVDSRGKYVLHEASDRHLIHIRNVPESNSEVTAQSSSLLSSYQLGDHGAFEFVSLQLAWEAFGSSEEEVGDLVVKTLQKLASLYRRTQPNTPLAKDYITIARHFASLPLGSNAMADPNAFLDVCRMLFYAVHNTPLLDRFDMTEDLIGTLGKLGGHARQYASTGSSRERLTESVDSNGGISKTLNIPLLELSELIVPLVARVLGRAQPCGALRLVQIENMLNLSTAVYCNPEQGTQIQGEYSKLSWCNEVFAADGRKATLFVLAEFTEDYIAESGVLELRGDESDDRKSLSNDGLPLSVNTADMASHGYALTKTLVLQADGEGAPTSDSGMIPADRKLGTSGMCFGLEQRVQRTEDIFGDRAEVVCSSLKAVEYINSKTFNVTLPADPYLEADLISSPSFERSNDDAEAMTSKRSVSAVLPQINGKTFGVKRGSCIDTAPRLLGFEAVAGVTVGILLTVLVSTAGLCIIMTRLVASAASSIIDAFDGSPYIERDVYGRDMIHTEAAHSVAVGDITEAAEATAAIGRDDDEEVFAAGGLDLGATPRSGAA